MKIWLPDPIYRRFPWFCYGVSGAACYLGTGLCLSLGFGMFVYATVVVSRRYQG